MTIKFISYSGSYPTLCFGTLVIEVDGVEHCLQDVLRSGGNVRFTKDWDEIVEDGPWSIRDLPDELYQYEDEITELVNDNVPYGCCGGCI